MRAFPLFLLLVASLSACLESWAWSSKDLPLFDPIHQQAIDAVLKGVLSDGDRDILKQRQVDVDEDQEPAQSYEHAMTGVEKGQDEAVEKPLYIVRTEQHLHDLLGKAIRARKDGDVHMALYLLGQAIHAMEDATSPAHEFFQPWRWDESYWQIAKHVAKERSYPDDPRRKALEDSVRWAYALYLEQTPMPVQFFDARGGLLFPSAPALNRSTP
jgi:hypothetical protein